MKLSKFLSILIIITDICQSNQQYLSLTNHTTEHKSIITGSWRDLLGVTVECPNLGILKNFVLRKNSSEFWYEYQCYSSKSTKLDRGEPIIKYIQFKISSSIRNIESFAFEEDIAILHGFPLYCNVDNGLNSFKSNSGSNGIILGDVKCHPLKSKYSTKIEIQTEEITANATSMDGLVDIVVGSQEIEDDENIAYPLRGFKYNVDTTSSEEKPTVSYLYGYSILRNMKKEYESAKQTFKALRKNNTQTD